MKRFLIITGIFILFTLSSYTQDPVKVYRNGLPFMKNYSPDETGAGEQNWAIIMDNRGVMYFGNLDNGVLEFDGVNWKNIPISNNSIVRSLEIDDKGTIYVGAIGEIGYLKPDDFGELQYISLLSKIDTTNRDFSNVWKTLFYKNNIYFCSTDKFFKYSPEKDSISIINSVDFGFKYGLMNFIVKNRFYHGDYGAGLLELDADTLRVVKGGDHFYMQNIMGMIPGEGNKILIGTSGNGIVLYNPETGNIEENIISADANNFIKERMLYQVISLGNGRLGLGTIYGGFLIINKEGHIEQIFNKSNGMQDETVYFSYVNQSQPSQSPLWLALNSGITKLEINSPLTKFTELSGFKDPINDIIQYKGKIFVCTNSGVYFMEGDKIVSFRKVKNINMPAWSFLKFDAGRTIPERLLVGSSEGLFDISGIEEGILIDENVVDNKPKGNKYYIYELAGSSINGNKIYLGMNTGLIILEYKNGTWYQAYEKKFNQEIRSVYEDDKGNVWIGVSNELYKYDRDFEKDFSIPYYALIRQVSINADSVLFYGTNYSVANNGQLYVDLKQPEELIPEIDYNHNNITFYWAAPFFEPEEASLYRYWLEGYSNEWSRWNGSLINYHG